MSPTATVEALPGYKLSCSAEGSLPIRVALIKNSTVLLNTTRGALGRIPLNKDGNYSCVAKNLYGTDVRYFSVIFNGKTSMHTIPIVRCIWIVLTIIFPELSVA